MTASTLRVAYFGLPLGALLLCADGHALVTCTLSPIVAPGRRRLERWLSKSSVMDALEPGSGFEARVEQALIQAKPDLIVSWFWTRRLPPSWLALAKWGGFGVHPSLLPRHRGPNPFFWAIDQGDPRTGVSAHRLDTEYDTGDVYEQEACEIADRNSWQLARALDRPSLRVLRRVAQRFASGTAPVATPQEPATVTWAPEPSGAELRVDWTWPTERVLRRIRALAPTPGLALEIRDIKFLALAASACSEFPRALEPGEAAITTTPAQVLIRTGDGAVSLERALLEDDTAVEGDAPARGDVEPDVELSGEELAALLGQRSGDLCLNSVIE